MKGIDYYKKYIDGLINQQPTTITIERTEDQDNGYGGTVPVDLPPVEHQVLIYKKRSSREVIDTSGMIVGFQATGTWKMLAKGDADIIRGDTFTSDGMNFKVLQPTNYYDICKQIELEVVSYV